MPEGWVGAAPADGAPGLGASSPPASSAAANSREQTEPLDPRPSCCGALPGSSICRAAVGERLARRVGSCARVVEAGNAGEQARRCCRGSIWQLRPRVLLSSPEGAFRAPGTSSRVCRSSGVPDSSAGTARLCLVRMEDAACVVPMTQPVFARANRCCASRAAQPHTAPLEARQQLSWPWQQQLMAGSGRAWDASLAEAEGTAYKAGQPSPSRLTSCTDTAWETACGPA